MSFYGHPYVITPQGCYYPTAAQQRQASPHPAQQIQRQASPHQHDAAQLALEERQALAYLHSVRRRREAAEAAAALEARERAKAQAEREAALRAAAERHNALIQAAKRERAMREAIERERAREAAFAQAMQARQNQQVQAAIEAERRRQTAAAEAYARAVAEHRREQAQRQAPQVQQLAQRATASQAQAQQTPQARQAPQEENDEVDLEGLNALLGQLFGFNIASGEPTDKPREAPKPATAPSTTEKAPEAPKPSSVVPSPTSAPATEAKTDGKPDTDEAELPEDLNALLNQFLGLDVTPAADGERGNHKASQQLVGNAVTDLNAFLSQYGLEFVPESESESESEEDAEQINTKSTEPSVKIVNEAGWANLPAENDKNANKAAQPSTSGSSSATANALATTPATTAAPVGTESKPATESEPESKPESKPASESKPSARPRQASREPDEDAPFTSTLSSYQQLPPYLRDILSQMEAALVEEETGATDECGCDPTTKTPCAHGTDGHPCAAHRQRHRRERALAKKRASQERRNARKAKRFAEKQGEKDAAGIPFGATPDDITEHFQAYSRAAAAGPIVQGAHVHQQRADAHAEKDDSGIPENATAEDIAEHFNAYTQAAAAGPVVAEGHQRSAERAQHIAEAKDAIPDVPGYVVAEHREAAAEAAQVGKSVEEHREVATDAAQAGKAFETSQLDASAPAVNPAPASKEPQSGPRRDAQPSSQEAKVAIQRLDAIAAMLKDKTATFTLPKHLAFAPSLADATQPPLLYNRNNTPYHAQAHMLMQLLLAVDDVPTGGDRAVRQRRKAVVKEIEGALNDLERGRDAAWAEVRGRRERGESDDSDDEWVMGDTTDATSDLEA